MTINELEPKEVWGYFHEITQIPRPSKKEEKIRAYLLDFARKNNLEAKQDRAGNVLITKPAVPGKEHVPTVILQAHMDMVCEKNNEVVHDFDTDPIETVIDGDWVRAKGTTLGADNGMGIAAALAVLASKDIAHGKIEALFTVDEETGLTGANLLEADFLTGNILLNLDTEEEGQIYIGCAGGKNTVARFTRKPKPAPEGYFWFKVQVKGLRGGHSGSDIDKGLGNANKILTRFLYAFLDEKYKPALVEIGGGNLHNAIPREAYAIAGVKDRYKENVRVKLNTFLAEIQEEYQAVEPNLNMLLESVEVPSTIIDGNTAEQLILALYACPHGVMRMSSAIPGLVETSTNLASVKMRDNQVIEVVTSQRSSVESSKEDAANMVTSVFRLAGAEVTHSDGYPGWKPNPDSEILKKAMEIYQDLFNKMPEVKAIHAGLECGLFLKKYPQLDMISIGPTMTDVHSPNEKVYIPSVAKWWTFLVKMLENISA